MRTLSATLTANQKLGGVGLYKIVLTKAGENTLTYGIDTANRIVDMKHDEQEWNQTAKVAIDNFDGTLTALDIWGYKGVISYGFNDPAQGDEYSPVSPLYVIGQKTITSFYPDADFVTVLSLAGVFNLMSEDHASVAYEPDEINTDTVKTIMTAIAEASLACFDHCKAWTITFDSEDTLIDSFKPADAFRVGFNESRLSAFKKLIRYTKCKARVEDDGEIHIYDPTITGTSYDYEYNDANAATNHWFYQKSVRKRVVIPGKVVVSTHPAYGGTAYTGNATDDDYSNNPTELQIPEYIYVRATSNAQCTAIATARLQGHQLRAEKGHGKVPMNCGAEVLDYIKITDSAAGDTRVGNIGYISRHCAPGVFEMEFGFGTLELLGLAGTTPPRAVTTTVKYEGGEDYQALVEQVGYLTEELGKRVTYDDLEFAMLGLAEILEDKFKALEWSDRIAKLDVYLRLQIPQGTDMYT